MCALMGVAAAHGHLHLDRLTVETTTAVMVGDDHDTTVVAGDEVRTFN